MESMTVISQPMTVTSQPVSMDENIIAEAILGYPSFRNRTCFQPCHCCWSDCCRCTCCRCTCCRCTCCRCTCCRCTCCRCTCSDCCRCTCSDCCPCTSTTRLYLTNSSIVYTGGSPCPRTIGNFRIDLKNIGYIKSINGIKEEKDCRRREVRGHSKLIIQVTDNSPQMMLMRWCFPCCCVQWEIDSYEITCQNGDEFVEAVKFQMAALNVKI